MLRKSLWEERWEGNTHRKYISIHRKLGLMQSHSPLLKNTWEKIHIPFILAHKMIIFLKRALERRERQTTQRFTAKEQQAIWSDFKASPGLINLRSLQSPVTLWFYDIWNWNACCVECLLRDNVIFEDAWFFFSTKLLFEIINIFLKFSLKLSPFSSKFSPGFLQKSK